MADNPDHADWTRMQLTLRNHTPPEAVVPLIEDVRSRALELAHAIIGACPASRERSLALTHLEDSTMWAVKAIVLPRGEP